VIYKAVVVCVTLTTMLANFSVNEERSVAGNRQENKECSFKRKQG
jgi:hypothetical protein